MPETEKGRLTFIDERNAWFCTDPGTAWGDDWNDAPHDCNAGLPYFDRGGDWYRVMFDPGNLELVGVQFGQAEDKWGVLSVQEINEGAAPWLAEFDWRSGDLVNEVPAGVSVPEFVELLKKSGGKVFFPEAVGSVSAPVKGCEKCAGTGVRSVHVEFPNGYGAGGSVDCDCRTTPVPGPVVNEETLALAVEAGRAAFCEQCFRSPMEWDDLSPYEQGQWRELGGAVLNLPQVRAAFEAQAKLEALLAGEGDLPEGWTWKWEEHATWLTDGQELDAQRSGLESSPSEASAELDALCPWLSEIDSRRTMMRHLVGPAVRVEEGGEGS